MGEGRWNFNHKIYKQKYAAGPSGFTNILFLPYFILLLFEIAHLVVFRNKVKIKFPKTCFYGEIPTNFLERGSHSTKTFFKKM